MLLNITRIISKLYYNYKLNKFFEKSTLSLTTNHDLLMRQYSFKQSTPACNVGHIIQKVFDRNINIDIDKIITYKGVQSISQLKIINNDLNIDKYDIYKLIHFPFASINMFQRTNSISLYEQLINYNRIRLLNDRG